MKILVCVKQAQNGELNPFDAVAYEAALRIKGADDEVILLSMAPEKSKEMLLSLTRLGAKKAYLLNDRAFAGADTLATAYTLSLAVKKIEPDLVICGRQTIDGDTAQTGPSLAITAGLNLITNVLDIIETNGKITCKTRDEGARTVDYPALITVERFCSLRFPSIRSKVGEVITLSAADLDADISRCGLKGSPTKVLKTFENEEGRRKCTFITPDKLHSVINDAREKGRARLKKKELSEKKLNEVWIIGEKPREMAETISDNIRVIEPDTAKNIADLIRKENPSVVLWASDSYSKATAPQVAALLKTGLCADCTALETDGDNLFMYRPAFSGNIIAKISCETRPQMATVRTVDTEGADMMVALGLGAVHFKEKVFTFAEKYGAEMGASRGAVDADVMPYENQIGLTGKSVSPAVYVAVGISGAVHHIEGMKRSGTVIAINKDKDAPIFDYADYGIIADAQEIL